MGHLQIAEQLTHVKYKGGDSIAGPQAFESVCLLLLQTENTTLLSNDQMKDETNKNGRSNCFSDSMQNRRLKYFKVKAAVHKTGPHTTVFTQK